MKVLVTGVGGQIGNAIIASAPQEMNVSGLDRNKLDLTDISAIEQLIRSERPDWLINAAAYTAVDKAEEEPELAMRVNAQAPQAMARTLGETGGRMLQFSTDFVFDGKQARPYRIDDTPRPLSQYGRSKLAGEDLRECDAIVLRTSWVYAAGGANFVRTMLRLMRESGQVSVVSDQIGSPSWAPGVARTAWALLGKGAHGTFHHRDAGIASWYDFAVAIAEEGFAAGILETMPDVLPITAGEFGAPAVRPACSVLDDSATRAMLKDRSAHWRVNLRKMLQEEKALG